MDHEEFLLVLEFIHMVILNGGPCHLRMTLCITKREKAESEAQRGKPKGTLESEIRSAISWLGQRCASALRAVLVWEGRDR